MAGVTSNVASARGGAIVQGMPVMPPGDFVGVNDPITRAYGFESPLRVNVSSYVCATLGEMPARLMRRPAPPLNDSSVVTTPSRRNVMVAPDSGDSDDQPK